MPIAELTYEEMERIIRRGKTCGQCGGNLSIAWDGERYILRCRDLSHNTILSVEPKDERRLEAEKTFRRNMLKGTELEKLDQEQMLERVNKAKFPSDLNQNGRALLATIAREYGLDPLMGELTIYQGVPYVPLTARLRKAQETGEFNGANTRPATQEEKIARGLSDGDYLFLATVRRKGCDFPFEAWGTVKETEYKGKSQFLPVVKDPASHAEKRAIARALKLAFHLPLPSSEEPEETAIEGKFEVVSETSEADIADRLAANVKANQEAKAKTAAPKPIESKSTTVPKPKAETTAKAVRDPDTLKDSTAMLKAVHEDFGIQPPVALEKLKVKTQLDISDTPAECYRKILATVGNLPF